MRFFFSEKVRKVNGFLFIYALVLFFLYYAPYMNGIDRISSDTAIPVIMSQDPHSSFYSFFYYGQDRFGGLPFLFNHFLGFVFRFEPSLISLYLQACIVFSFSILTFSQWFKLNNILFLSFLIFMMSGLKVVPSYLFDMCIVYIWQLSFLMFYFVFVSKVFTQKLEFKNIFWAGLMSFLAQWMNPLSIVFEALFLCVYFSKKEKFKFSMVFFFSLIIPFVTYMACQSVYKFLNVQVYGKSFAYPIEAFHLKNLGIHLIQNFEKLGSVYFFMSFLIFCIISQIKKNTEISRIVFAMNIMALVNFLLCTVSKYSFQNGFPLRYFVPTLFLIIFSFSISVVLFFKEFSEGKKSAFALFLIIFSILFIAPFISLNKQTQKNKFVAQLIEHYYPHKVILGDYWNSYLYRGFQSSARASVPLVFQNQYNRMIWNCENFRLNEKILVSTKWFARNMPEEFYPFTEHRMLKNEFSQYGFVLEHEQDELLDKLDIPFALYKISRKDPVHPARCGADLLF